MQSSLRKEQIIITTLEIIGEEGLAGLTVAKISENVGVSEAALYKHFKSKDDIISHCIAMIEKRLIGTIENIANEDTKSLDKLIKIFRIHMDHIQINRGIPRIIYTAEVHSVKKFRTRVYKIIEKYIFEIEKMIIDGQKKGEISKNINHKEWARRFLSMVQFSAFRYSLSGFDQNIIEEGMSLLESFLENLKKF